MLSQELLRKCSTLRLPFIDDFHKTKDPHALSLVADDSAEDILFCSELRLDPPSRRWSSCRPPPRKHTAPASFNRQFSAELCRLRKSSAPTPTFICVERSRSRRKGSLFTQPTLMLRAAKSPPKEMLLSKAIDDLHLHSGPGPPKSSMGRRSSFTTSGTSLFDRRSSLSLKLPSGSTRRESIGPELSPSQPNAEELSLFGRLKRKISSSVSPSASHARSHSLVPKVHQSTSKSTSPKTSVTSPKMSVTSPKPSLILPKTSVTSPKPSLILPKTSVTSPKTSVTAEPGPTFSRFSALKKSSTSTPPTQKLSRSSTQPPVRSLSVSADDHLSTKKKSVSAQSSVDELTLSRCDGGKRSQPPPSPTPSSSSASSRRDAITKLNMTGVFNRLKPKEVDLSEPVAAGEHLVQVRKSKKVVQPKQKRQRHSSDLIYPHQYTEDPTVAWEMLKTKRPVKLVRPMKLDAPIRPDHVRFVCIACSHGNYIDPKNVPPGDVLIIAGDFTSCGLPKEIKAFNENMGQLKHTYKVVIAGNHECTFDQNFMKGSHKDATQAKELALKQALQAALSSGKISNPKSLLTNCIYLEDSEVELFGLKIYGTPWQPTFDNWAFNTPRGQHLLDKWNQVPVGVDVLVSHTPPLGHGDLLASGARTGCVELLNSVSKRIRPKYHVFGHIHEGYGCTTDGYTKFINCCMCDHNLQPTNDPVIFDVHLPTETKQHFIHQTKKAHKKSGLSKK